MSDVRHFGAVGDGQRDDTEAIQHAIDEGDGEILFSPGTYVVRRTLVVELSRTGLRSLRGEGGTARLIFEGDGPAIRLLGQHQGTSDPPTVKPATWLHERMPQIVGLEIIGANPNADGIELRRTMQTIIQRVLIRRVRHGIRLTERNRNVLISASHIYDNTGCGIFIDRCNLHQMIVSACHISFNRQAGIHSRDGDLHNLQITGNDIEYNYDPAQRGAADIFFDARKGVASEITIASNTIQARVSEDGANIRILGAAPAAEAARSGAALPGSARLISITGNVIGSQNTNLQLHDVDGIAIVGNTIYDGRQHAIAARGCLRLSVGTNTFGWRLGPERQMNDTIVLDHCRNSLLHGLTIHDVGGSPTKAERPESQTAAISLLDCHDTSVSQCQITSPPEVGIRLRGGHACRVDSNTIVDRRQPPRMQAAIDVAGQAGSHLVQNNLLGPTINDPIRVAPGTATIRGNTIATPTSSQHTPGGTEQQTPETRPQ